MEWLATSHRYPSLPSPSLPSHMPSSILTFAPHFVHSPIVALSGCTFALQQGWEHCCYLSFNHFGWVWIFSSLGTSTTSPICHPFLQPQPSQPWIDISLPDKTEHFLPFLALHQYDEMLCTLVLTWLLAFVLRTTKLSGSLVLAVLWFMIYVRSSVVQWFWSSLHGSCMYYSSLVHVVYCMLLAVQVQCSVILTLVYNHSRSDVQLRDSTLRQYCSKCLWILPLLITTCDPRTCTSSAALYYYYNDVIYKIMTFTTLTCADYIHSYGYRPTL